MPPGHRETFGISLQAAKRNFDTAQLQVSKQNYEPVKASLDAMLFECARARRIARDAPKEIKALEIDTDQLADSWMTSQVCET